ncbi:hypothetical protein EZJ49_03820 [Bdellovibrio bacteriovorus]|uniref:hypothetical protein n=1 Tax=Bdellovibrio bacteriovorus TaxID=959 RepID=UPI0021CE92CB|nr:hypothetical protein [Bdellovibrio bacteriovorus]UXR65379.1 hypothetical protein EZJ49_03820 [Bdellovibrio bacteriovorus]
MKHHPTKPPTTKPTQKPSPPIHKPSRHQGTAKPDTGRVHRTPEGTIEESYEEQAP